MERSMFYEMTLEQRWEQFFTCQNGKINEGNSVLVDVTLDTEVVFIGGTNKATWDDKNVVEGRDEVQSSNYEQILLQKAFKHRQFPNSVSVKHHNGVFRPGGAGRDFSFSVPISKE
ncbi:hypothetical protein RND71_023530 [Anisodus tanguticus]|uniref:Uncharacterized protein n=1 Tax=Anisodus tanguticus TaxID=243964 RepID=A0AAE1RT94_9SOLA|nr:hypothetical protein RND71_023530 [Anisodus tanguticus]